MHSEVLILSGPLFINILIVFVLTATIDYDVSVRHISGTCTHRESTS
jgi:hypothetical protein